MEIMASKLYTHNKVIPFPQTNGHFIYDAQNDKVLTMNKKEREIWGWGENQVVQYKDVLSNVDSCLDLFQQESLGHNKTHIITSEITTKTGNVIREDLTYTYSSEDYENKSLLRIEGVTNLLRVA